jgi:glycosyltransferase involved in cell wall biosynthesis
VSAATDTRPVIALVTDAIHPFHRGGKELRYHEVGRRLAERGDVHVYTMHWWDGPADRRENGVTYHALAPLRPLYSGDRRSVRQAVLFALCCLRLLFRRFDVLEADHMPYLQLFPLRLVASLRRKPLYVTWHEVWGPRYWREYLGPAGVVGWWLERLAMQLPDGIIAASSETGERLRAHLGPDADVTVTPNGVDLDAIRRAPAARERTDLVVVGRLLEHKRVDRLLDAVALLRDRGTDVTLRVIGDGPERAALRAQILRLGIGDRVELRHDVASQTELYGLVKAARVFAFPSEREGFGIAVLEALACGLPVVTTSARDNLARHLVRDRADGVVCAPRTLAFADAIEGVLRFTPPREDGDAWLGEYDWTAIADRVYRTVVA